MRRPPMMFGDLRFRPAKPRLSAKEHFAARERRFLRSASLALAGAFAFVPAWFFLVFRPRISHARLAAFLVLPLLGLAGLTGVKRLVCFVLEQPFDVLTALSFGVLLILAVVAVYAGMFLFVLRAW